MPLFPNLLSTQLLLNRRLLIAPANSRRFLHDFSMAKSQAAKYQATANFQARKINPTHPSRAQLSTTVLGRSRSGQQLQKQQNHVSGGQHRGSVAASEVSKELDFSEARVEAVASCQMEFRRSEEENGAGGTESMLFVGDLMHMYENYVNGRGWAWKTIEVDNAPKGGVRSAVVAVTGPHCYSQLRFEAGVHRVQRCPATDPSRMHTSTASIVVMPEMENPEFELSKRDVKEEAMRSSGAGGANVNAKSTCMRLTHLPTGMSVKCQDERFLEKNKQIAYRRLGAMILQNLVEKHAAKLGSARRVQVTSLDRAEKIRTYNYRDGRITDHRIKLMIKGGADFHDYLQGGENLAHMIDAVQEAYLQDEIAAGHAQEGKAIAEEVEM